MQLFYALSYLLAFNHLHSSSAADQARPSHPRDLMGARTHHPLVQRSRLNALTDPHIRLEVAGTSPFVFLHSIKAAEMLVAMVGHAWASPSAPMVGYLAFDEATHTDKIAASIDAARMESTQMLGYLGIAGLQRLLDDIEEGESSIWTGPFNFDYFADRFMRSDQRVGKLMFDSPLISASSNQTTGSGGSFEALLHNSSLPDPSKTTSLSALTGLRLSVKSYGDPLSIHQFISLIFEGLRSQIWTQHEADDSASAKYPVGQKLELVANMGSDFVSTSLFIEILKPDMQGQAITFGVLHRALYGLLINPPDMVIADCRVRVSPDEVPMSEESEFLELTFGPPNTPTVGGTPRNQTRFRGNSQHDTVDRNVTVIAS